MNRKRQFLLHYAHFVNTVLFSYTQYGGDVFLFFFSTFSVGGNASMTAKSKIKITPTHHLLQNVLYFYISISSDAVTSECEKLYYVKVKKN